MTPETTIATLSTPPGRGGIAIIRLTGPDARSILDRVFFPLPSHRNHPADGLRLGHIRKDRQTIDQAVVAVDQHAVEINIHGGSAVARAVMNLLAECGASPGQADPGSEFPRAHRRWNNPGIGRDMLVMLQQCKTALAAQTVGLQYSAGLSELLRSQPRPQQLRQAADRWCITEKLIHPPDVALVGPPNAGKSTLTNYLVGRDVSIVHETAGTTRDWVRELAVLKGCGVYLTDTAGLWQTEDHIDAEAVRRARLRAEQADLVCLLTAEPADALPDWLDGCNVLRVAGKCDLHPPDGRDLAVSAETGDGIDALIDAVLHRLGLDDIDPTQPTAFTARQANLLDRAADGDEQAVEKILLG